MIVLYPEGGLGNQLFQYTAAITLSKLRNDEKIIIDTEFYKEPGSRRYELNKFNLPQIHVSLDEDKKNLEYSIAKKVISLYRKNIMKGTFFSKGVIDRLIKKILIRFGIYISIGSIEENKSIPSIISRKRNIYLYGYFQYPYFINDLKIELKVKNLILKSWMNDNESGEHVCIHIRLGDYVGNKYWEVCTKEYYYKAMKYVANNVSNPIFHVFSDDIYYVKNNFNFPYSVIYEEEKNTSVCLVKMSKCKHFILSNSTYSWWAQRLSQNENKIVIAPMNWYGDKKRKFYLYEKTWNKITP